MSSADNHVPIAAHDHSSTDPTSVTPEMTFTIQDNSPLRTKQGTMTLNNPLPPDSKGLHHQLRGGEGRRTRRNHRVHPAHDETTVWHSLSRAGASRSAPATVPRVPFRPPATSRPPSPSPSYRTRAAKSASYMSPAPSMRKGNGAKKRRSRGISSADVYVHTGLHRSHI